MNELHLPSMDMIDIRDRFNSFLSPDALAINKARLEHLSSLGLNLDGKAVLEVGADIGLHTSFFEERSCRILSTDARLINVEEMQRRYPHRKVAVLDLNCPEEIIRLEPVDIVYCYGTLSHLPHPDQTLQALGKICREFILIETCVTPGSGLAINPIEEEQFNPNQAVDGIGCRPTRDRMMMILKKSFGYAYVTKTQPDHRDFELDWVNPPSKDLYRSVFIGSKKPIVNQLLLEKPPDYQGIDPELEGQIWFDVGAHLGETTYDIARKNRWLTVYAFEPNLDIVSQIPKLLNFVVIPCAVASTPGARPFYFNTLSVTNSLLPFNLERLEKWVGGDNIQPVKVVTVPTIRLDEFLEVSKIETVSFLKIDAQRADLDVVKSAGSSLRQFLKIKLEVATTETQLYQGAASKEDVVAYLTHYGFILEAAEQQTFCQEENLTFVRKNSAELVRNGALELDFNKTPLVLIKELAQTAVYCRPLGPYPGWHFDMDTVQNDKFTQLRYKIWDFFRNKNTDTFIFYEWYYNLVLSLELGNDISKQLYIGGAYDPNEFFYLDSILKPGMTFIDVGANVGLYTLFAAKAVGETGHVLSFEPSLREVANLKRNIELNHLNNIKILNMAVSDKAGIAQLLIANSEHAGQNTLGDFVWEGVRKIGVETVQTCCLDAIFKESNIDVIDVIKVDAEGSELAVFKGATSILKRFHPVLLFEVSENSLKEQGANTRELSEFLEKLGYSFYCFDKKTGLVRYANEEEITSNVIGLHPERKWLGQSEQAPYLSIVATARNDNHGGQLLRRMQIFINGILQHCLDCKLDAELIIVEWNPPPDKSRLAEVLQWPHEHPYCQVRIIEVAQSLHNQYKHSEVLPLFQMIAKNVGIHRARGRFVLATNIDLLFTRELFEYIAARRLKPGEIYRVDRYDASSDVPLEASLDQQLEFCRNNVLRIMAKGKVLMPEQLNIQNCNLLSPVNSEYNHEHQPSSFNDRQEFVRNHSLYKQIAFLAFKKLNVMLLKAVVAAGRYMIPVKQRRHLTRLLPPEMDYFLRRKKIFCYAGTQDRKIDHCLQISQLNEETTLVLGPLDINPTETKNDALSSKGRFYKFASESLSSFAKKFCEIGIAIARKIIPGDTRKKLLHSLPPELDLMLRRRHILTPAPVTALVTAPVPAPVPILTRTRPDIHTNACGDFTLLAQEDWHRLYAYAEFEMYSMHIDSVLCYAAYHAGIKEVILNDPMRIYHIEHAGGWTPESDSKLNERLASSKIRQMTYQELLELENMMCYRSGVTVLNDENWGLALEYLPEQVVVSRNNLARFASQDTFKLML